MVDSPSHTSTIPTRTVAIIKPHALSHRLDIERRIIEAGFEIAKERQMMFQENDKDVEDLFGANNAATLAEGPCWVYVLERRRAVEVLKTLMGSEDPEQARQTNSNSLRGLYGVSLVENAIFGSPDTTTAEHQISILFASSPPIRATELPDSPPFERTGSLRSITSSILSELNRQNGDEHTTEAAAPSVSSKASATGRSSTAAGSFRARPIPASIAEPVIKPRLSHAAALRAGLVDPRVSIWSDGPRKPLSKAEKERTFANVPGHKRSETISVASVAPPVIAPRMTKAAALRQGIKEPTPVKPRQKDSGAEAKTFEGVPGHRRRETITVASVQAPSAAPRLNRAAALRAEREKAPPSSYMFRTPSSVSRTPSTSAASGDKPRPSSSMASNTSSRRSSTASGQRPSSATLVRPADTSTASPKRSPSATPAAIPTSLGKPTIEPRQNKSALLRAKKLEAAQKADGKLNGRPVFV